MVLLGVMGAAGSNDGTAGGPDWNTNVLRPQRLVPDLMFPESIRIHLHPSLNELDPNIGHQRQCNHEVQVSVSKQQGTSDDGTAWSLSCSKSQLFFRSRVVDTRLLRISEAGERKSHFFRYGHHVAMLLFEMLSGENDMQNYTLAGG